MVSGDREGRVQGLPDGVLKQVNRYLITCFRQEAPPRVAELARHLGLPLSRFVETFHRATGMTPSAYLKESQITAAKLLVLRTSMTMDRIAYATGFGTRRTLFREFRKHTGMSPAGYRRRRRIVSRLRN